jgi:hypothetical protein
MEQKNKIVKRDLEEFSAEITPNTNDLPQLNQRTTALIIGYIGLFFALFSMVFFPLFLGISGICCGVYAIKFQQKTLGYTVIAFASFSILFTLAALR